jgi:hypothetical protein
MIKQINDLLGETDSDVLAEFYTSIFYSCFADMFLSGFTQSAKSFCLSKHIDEGCIDVIVTISFEKDKLPSRPEDSVRFYELLNIVGGNQRMAKISPIIEFKILPENFLSIDKWLSDLSSVSFEINLKSRLDSDDETEEIFSVKNLKIIEEYKVENLSLAKTASGSIIDISNKLPATFTVTISDWVVEALSKDYLRLNVGEKLLRRKKLLPVVE